MTADRLPDLARGILIGEALAWTDADYRLRLLPPKRLARMETLAAFAREHRTTTPTVPYAHSSPVAVLEPGAGEATEWFAFTAAALLRSRAAGGFAPLDGAWREVAETAGPTRIGTRIPLENLRRGLAAPQSGNDNPHYFDDMPMVRAVAATGVFDAERDARDAARRDAGVTGALDGVWCAEAIAVLFAQLLHGRPVAEAIEGALAVLPAETWSRRMAEEALATAAESSGALDRAQRLAAGVGDRIYSYSTVAPETLAMLLAHLSCAASADELMLGVLAQPRNAATLPALAGAAAAIRFGESWMPAHLQLTAELTGISIPSLRGVLIADALADRER
jgi:hypothetical protein